MLLWYGLVRKGGRESKLSRKCARRERGGHAPGCRRLALL